MSACAAIGIGLSSLLGIQPTAAYAQTQQPIEVTYATDVAPVPASLPPCPHQQFANSFQIPDVIRADGQLNWARSCRYTDNGYYLEYTNYGTTHLTGPICADWSPDQSRQWSTTGMVPINPAQAPIPTMSVMRSQIPGGQNWWLQHVGGTFYIGTCPGYTQAPPQYQAQTPPAPPQQTQLGYSPQQPQYQPPAPPPASYQPAPDGTSTQTTSDTVTITVSDTNTNTATASANGNSVTIYFVMPGSCATCPPTVSTTPPPNFVPPASVPQVSQPVPAPPAPPTTLTPPSNLPRMGTSGIAACPVEKSTFTARFEGTKEDNWVILGPNNARYIGPPVNRFTVPNGISLTTASGEELPSGNEFMGGSGWIATSTGCQST